MLYLRRLLHLQPATDIRVYITGIFMLSKSLVIKSAGTADVINTHLKTINTRYVIPDDKRQWQYYRHLAGEQFVSDRPINVLSLDTKTIIPFTKASLAQHPVTADLYRYGGEHYDSLIRQYPELHRYIRGVVTPIDIDLAVSVADYSILLYDNSQVEFNESGLIKQLEENIQTLAQRWQTPAFQTSDEQYQAALEALIAVNVPAFIIELRERNTRTYKVNTFYVKRYLAQKLPGLEGYHPYLTHEQQMWLYMNIDYILQTRGTVDTFRFVVDWVLTKRSIPLYEYETAQTGFNGVDATFKHIERSINKIHGPESEPISTRELLALERDCGIWNNRIDESEIEALTSRQRFDRYETKVLRAKPVTVREPLTWTVDELAIELFGYLALSGKYTAAMSVVLTGDSGETYLTAADAFIYLLIMTSTQLLHVPAIGFKLGEAQESIPEAYTKVEINKVPIRFQRAFASYSRTYISMDEPSEFSALVKSRYLALEYLEYIQVTNGNSTARAYMESLLSDLHTITVVRHPDAGVDITSWLSKKGLTVPGTEEERDTRVREILTRFTGIDYSPYKDITVVNNALVQLQALLSSYSVHYIAESSEHVYGYPKNFLPGTDMVSAHTASNAQSNVAVHVNAIHQATTNVRRAALDPVTIQRSDINAGIIRVSQLLPRIRVSPRHITCNVRLTSVRVNNVHTIIE